MCTRTLSLVTLFLSLVAPVSLRAQGCQNWWQRLAQSYLPRQPDENFLKKLVGETAQQYHSSISQEERQHWAEQLGASVIEDDPDTERRLQAALTRFYDAGEQLYGVRLNPADVAILNKADANAFATGSLVFLHEGLLHYYLDPLQYWSQTGQSPQSRTPDQYNLLTNTFNWRDDWDSIYYALAHEASHNIMGHRDREVLGAVQQMLADYREQVTDRRKDLAEGRSRIATRGYVWRSNSRFLDSINQSERHREMESEADLVALTLLRQSGMDPQIALIGAQRLAMLVGYGVPEDFQASMTYSLCSTHPDWIARLDAMQTNLSCLQSTGHLCQEHVSYSVDTTLAALREVLSKLQSYDAETLRFAGGDSSLANGVTYDVLIDVDPKDAELKIDGNDVSSSSVPLLAGPHKLTAERPGYRHQGISFVVFPDVKSALKLKLKKQ